MRVAKALDLKKSKRSGRGVGMMATGGGGGGIAAVVVVVVVSFPAAAEEVLGRSRSSSDATAAVETTECFRSVGGAGFGSMKRLRR